MSSSDTTDRTTVKGRLFEGDFIFNALKGRFYVLLVNLYANTTTSQSLSRNKRCSGPEKWVKDIGVFFSV